MKNIKILTTFLLLITGILIAMFYYRFNLRIFFSTRFHLYIHLFITVLFSLWTFLTIFIVTKMRIKNLVKPFIIIGFFVAIILILTNIYYSDRKTEMFQYLVKNETNLKKIVDLYKTDEIQDFTQSDTNRITLQRKVNIRFCTRNYEYLYKDYKKVVFLNMFVFFGYGYGIAYSDKDNPIVPKYYHQSPMVDWYRIKDNWFYFEYFD